MEEGDLLRKALAKIESLQAQLHDLKGSGAPALSPTETPRRTSPSRSGSATDRKANEKESSKTADGDSEEDDGKDNQDAPITTPDGVTVAWLNGLISLVVVIEWGNTAFTMISLLGWTASFEGFHIKP